MKCPDKVGDNSKITTVLSWILSIKKLHFEHILFSYQIIIWAKGDNPSRPPMGGWPVGGAHWHSASRVHRVSTCKLAIIPVHLFKLIFFIFTSSILQKLYINVDTAQAVFRDSATNSLSTDGSLVQGTGCNSYQVGLLVYLCCAYYDIDLNMNFNAEEAYLTTCQTALNVT